MFLKFGIFETNMGWMGIAGTSTGIRKVIFPTQNKESVVEAIANGCEEISEEPCFSEIKDNFIRYFKGQRVDFSFPLDLDGYTDFQKSVWNVTKSIPYGQLRNYGWVASQMGNPKAVRAVGQALGKNPIPIIIPCHRVIGSDGSLHGFTGGLHWKQKLIELENGHYVR